MKKNNILHILKLVWLSLLFLLLAGCGNEATPIVEASEVLETPTVHHAFAKSAEVVEAVAVGSTGSTQESLFQPVEVPTRAESVPVDRTPLPTLTPRPTVATRIVTIFDDALAENWSLEHSEQVAYDVLEEEAVYNGRFSLSFTPQIEYSSLTFAVLPESDDIYLREDVLAVTFWLYSGEAFIDPEDLLVSVVGSNEYTYWVADDQSVTVNDDRPVFPATRLFFLDVTEVVPPNTWIQIEVWLNDLIYDPEYKYVTGIIIKNDELFMRTAFVDDVEMVIKE